MASALDEVRDQTTRERWEMFRQHPVWQEITAHWAAVKQEKMSGYGFRALQGSLTENDAAELRGYWRGVFAVLEGRDYTEASRRQKER